MKKIGLFLLVIFLFSCSSVNKMIKQSKKTKINTPLYDSVHIDNEMIEEYVLEPVKSVPKPSITVDGVQDKSSNNPKSKPYNTTYNNNEESISENEKTSSKMGKMSYKIDDTMKVGKNYKVELRIGYKTTKAEKSKKFKTNIIKISKVMEVKLFEPYNNKAFLITQIQDSKQLITEDSFYTIWSWYVKPIKKGEQKLKLVINILKNTEEFGVSKKSINVFEKQLDIQANSKWEIKEFFKKYWQWIMSGFILPLLLFFIKRKFEDKK